MEGFVAVQFLKDLAFDHLQLKYQLSNYKIKII